MYSSFTAKSIIWVRKLYVIVGVWGLVSLVSCTVVTSRVLRQGYDEAEALEAIGKLSEKYSYIDQNQIFPDTYRFELPKEKIFNKIVQQLEKNGEIILERNTKDWLIYTAAKEAPLPRKDEETDDQERIYYQLSIFLTQKSEGITYVTTYPTVLKGDYMEVAIPLARNILRGIFFGSLAAEIYPNLKRKGLAVAKNREIASLESKTQTGGEGEEKAESKKRKNKEANEIVHIVQSGETLGGISRKYTGTVRNHEKIAEYNNIIDVRKIRVGQKLKIPGDLLNN